MVYCHMLYFSNNIAFLSLKIDFVFWDTDSNKSFNFLLNPICIVVVLYSMLLCILVIYYTNKIKFKPKGHKW